MSNCTESGVVIWGEIYVKNKSRNYCDGSPLKGKDVNYDNTYVAYMYQNGINISIYLEMDFNYNVME